MLALSCRWSRLCCKSWLVFQVGARVIECISNAMNAHSSLLRAAQRESRACSRFAPNLLGWVLSVCVAVTHWAFQLKSWPGWLSALETSAIFFSGHPRCKNLWYFSLPPPHCFNLFSCAGSIRAVLLRHLCVSQVLILRMSLVLFFSRRSITGP